MVEIDKKYYLYEATGSAGFMRPIMVLYVVAQGVSYEQLGVLSAFLSATVLLLEVPTGAVADRLGRRKSLLVSTLLYIVMTGGFVLAGSFWAFLPVYFARALAKGFLSGSSSSWLYDVLEERSATEEYTRIRGRGKTAQWVSLTLTVSVGGVLYTVDPLYPFYCTAVLNGIAFAVIWTFPEADHREEGVDHADPVRAVRQTLETIRTQTDDRTLRVYLVVICSFYGVISAANTYIQPLVAETYSGPAGLGLGISSLLPVGAALGGLYAVARLLSGVMSALAPRLDDAIGPHWSVVSVLCALAAALSLPFVTPVGTIVLFFVLNGPKALIRPISESFLNSRIDAASRATVMSFVSMVYSAVAVPVNLAIGFASTRFSLEVALLAVAVPTLGLGLLWVRYARVLPTGPHAQPVPPD